MKSLFNLLDNVPQEREIWSRHGYDYLVIIDEVVNNTVYFRNPNSDFVLRLPVNFFMESFRLTRNT